MTENLWEKVAMKCLENADRLLNSKYADTDDVIKSVERLVNVALRIDEADHSWKGDIDINKNERMLLGCKDTKA